MCVCRFVVLLSSIWAGLSPVPSLSVAAAVVLASDARPGTLAPVATAGHEFMRSGSKVSIVASIVSLRGSGSDYPISIVNSRSRPPICIHGRCPVQHHRGGDLSHRRGSLTYSPMSIEPMPPEYRGLSELPSIAWLLLQRFNS